MPRSLPLVRISPIAGLLTLLDQRAHRDDLECRMNRVNLVQRLSDSIQPLLPFSTRGVRLTTRSMRNSVLPTAAFRRPATKAINSVTMIDIAENTMSAALG